MIIKTQKKDTCPICARQIVAPNCWVRYHISYNPSLLILACKYCNFIENLLRNHKPIPLSWSKRNQYKPFKETRVEKVIKFQKKFNVSFSTKT